MFMKLSSWDRGMIYSRYGAWKCMSLITSITIIPQRYTNMKCHSTHCHTTSHQQMPFHSVHHYVSMHTAMPPRAILCRSIHLHTTPQTAIPLHSTQWHATPCFPRLLFALSGHFACCHATPHIPQCHATPCNDMPLHAFWGCSAHCWVTLHVTMQLSTLSCHSTHSTVPCHSMHCHATSYCSTQCIITPLYATLENSALHFKWQQTRPQSPTPHHRIPTTSYFTFPNFI